MSGDTVQEWTELLSTQEFTDLSAPFLSEDNLKVARQAVKSFSVTLKDSSEQEDDQQKAVFGDLPDVLAKVICRMTHLQTISLDLGPFTVEDGLKFDNAAMINRPLVIWPEMHSIRIRGPNAHAGCIMGCCDRLQLKALDLDKWIFSYDFKKAKAVEKLGRLRLYFDKDQMPDPEADSDRSNEFSSEGDVHKIKSAFEQVRKGLRSIKATRLAFHFDYRRFTPKITRSDLGILNTTSGPLEGHEIKQWHEMWIEYLMTVRTLQEVWIFTNSSLAFAGTRNSDEKVTVECLKILDFCWDT
ncbi:hypothetical protein FLAG1_08279 [Fusarium langsethiae]|uniref:Uncharacterized protein n=1 Tax=Fusarium langsethiae TaxID=179993 RepID=A0A0M9ESS4_FUSLA|nr:hypothetical protein FLAG1_08279 [Fusarium langsethiae]GKU19278.1 unnamed protein product [Fusarium langsethiae]